MLEYLAIFLSIAYLLLAAKESIFCWYCAFFSSLIYTVIFWDVSLLMDSMLNVFYMVMAVLGWYQWRKGSKSSTEHVHIKKLPYWQHGVIIVAVVVLALINGWLMKTYTSASWPFLDSFTTWAAIVTTFMVINKVLENWLYWIVIDGVSIYLYIDKGLNPTALLFAGYVVIAVFGYFAWSKKLSSSLS